MLQVVNKEAQSLLLTLTGFIFCFSVTDATLSKYLLARKGILGLEQQCFCAISFPANKHMLKVSNTKLATVDIIQRKTYSGK